MVFPVRPNFSREVRLLLSVRADIESSSLSLRKELLDSSLCEKLKRLLFDSADLPVELIRGVSLHGDEGEGNDPCFDGDMILPGDLGDVSIFFGDFSIFTGDLGDLKR
mmetsp:Transcript_52164/g.156559  ORF Transcript_52164/g.156559 Transcript_52164/m.156559 type:complete len:108 (+) Transcript_52164:184-507(+)